MNCKYFMRSKNLPMTFQDALKNCEKENFGKLASITSDELQTAINNERKKNKIDFMWIGLRKGGRVLIFNNWTLF